MKHGNDDDEEIEEREPYEGPPDDRYDNKHDVNGVGVEE
jgi:hypothetical protein